MLKCVKTFSESRDVGDRGIAILAQAIRTSVVLEELEVDIARTGSRSAPALFEDA